MSSLNSAIDMGIQNLAIEMKKDGESNDKISEYNGNGLTDDEIDLT